MNTWSAINNVFISSSPSIWWYQCKLLFLSFELKKLLQSYHWVGRLPIVSIFTLTIHSDVGENSAWFLMQEDIVDRKFFNWKWRLHDTRQNMRVIPISQKVAIKWQIDRIISTHPVNCCMFGLGKVIPFNFKYIFTQTSSFYIYFIHQPNIYSSVSQSTTKTK